MSTNRSTTDQLPMQEDVVGTYMTSSTVSWLIKSKLNDGNDECEVAMIWNTILQIEFPATAGYATALEAQIDGGGTDLFTRHVVFGNQAQVFEFLMVECRKPSVEGQNQFEADAQTQLSGHLSGIAKRGAKGRKFGAIAVGKTVRFFEWDKNGKNVLLLANGAYFYLDRQCASVTRWLRFFRDNHQ